MRHPFLILLVLAFAALLSQLTIAQTLYKSVGPDGKTVYSDRPPAEGRVEKTMKVESPPSSELPASAYSYLEQLRRSEAESSVKLPTSGVVLYSASWCRYCKAAKAYLASKNIAYQEIDIESKEGINAFAQAGGGNGVPVLIANGQRVQGFSTATYDAFFSGRK